MTEQLEVKPTIQGIIESQKTLEKIKRRSFSGRHPELGKMINCQICGLRHRQNERQCQQKFSTGRYDLRNSKPLLIAGETPETSTLGDKRKIILGAALFSKKRICPHKRLNPLKKNKNRTWGMNVRKDNNRNQNISS